MNQGIFKIGSKTNRFTNQARIILHGAKDSDSMVISPDAAGNKMLAATGGLEFYGIAPETVWTRLAETAEVGATNILVEEANDWKVGDKLAIAPSYSGRK